MCDFNDSEFMTVYGRRLWISNFFTVRGHKCDQLPRGLATSHGWIGEKFNLTRIPAFRHRLSSASARQLAPSIPSSRNWTTETAIWSTLLRRLERWWSILWKNSSNVNSFWLDKFLISLKEILSDFILNCFRKYLNYSFQVKDISNIGLWWNDPYIYQYLCGCLILSRWLSAPLGAIFLMQLRIVWEPYESLLRLFMNEYFNYL